MFARGLDNLFGRQPAKWLYRRRERRTRQLKTTDKRLDNKHLVPTRKKNGARNPLDFNVVRQRHQNGVMIFRALSGADADTDHHLAVVKAHHKLKFIRRKKVENNR